MKKLLFIAFVLGSIFANAQQLVVTTPSSSLQSYNTAYISGYDSANEATAKQTIPSSYFTFTHQLSLAANKKIVDTIVFPSNPVIGQTVEIVSNKNFYHLLITVPKAVLVDSSGSQDAKWKYSGKNWQLIH